MLLLALSCPVFAGEIHTPGAPEPPPVQSTTDSTVATSSLIQTALAVIVSVLP
jgi:hypothetical protein